MPLGNPKRKTHEIHMNEGKSRFLKKYSIGTKIVRNKKNQFQKDF
jgi:hypothetical protein